MPLGPWGRCRGLQGSTPSPRQEQPAGRTWKRVKTWSYKVTTFQTPPRSVRGICFPKPCPQKGYPSHKLSPRLRLPTLHCCPVYPWFSRRVFRRLRISYPAESAWETGQLPEAGFGKSCPGSAQGCPAVGKESGHKNLDMIGVLPAPCNGQAQPGCTQDS